MNRIRKNCDGHAPFTRRHFLFGAASATLLRPHADAEVVTSRNARPRGTAKTCIFINMNGGPSHLDTWDPKDGPWNPADVNIQQYSGGIALSKTYFPKLTGMTNDLLLLRSCSSWEAAHERGQFYIQTSHSSNPALMGETPHVGAVVGYERGFNGLLPPFLAFNQTLQGSTFLGGPYMPMMPPATRTGVATLTHNYFGTASQQRFLDRFQLLKDLDEPIRNDPPNAEMAAYSGYYDRARQMMYNDSVDAVFKFSTDDEGRYGANAIGRALIVSRNAIKGKMGVSYISVTQSGWDTHVGQFDRGTTSNIYQLTNDLDRAVSSLVDDLRASGDLASTLIVMMGEFGRTPGVLNSRSGRDHYRPAMSVAMIGGGVKGGRVIGKTSSTGSAVTDPGWSMGRPIYPDDIAATVYSALGIDWTKGIDDTPSGRRFYYINSAADGAFVPVEEVFG
jgi:hypothetical protein